MKTRTAIACCAAALLVGIWALYAQTGSFDFIRLDDHDYTFRCPFVKDGLSWANLVAACTSVTHAAIWMPLTYATYMCDVSAFGPGMGAHHLVNVCLHACTSLLVFAFLLQLVHSHSAYTPREPRTTNHDLLPVFACFIATALWAFHPLRVEAVAWIAGRKEILFTCFTLAGLICWMRGHVVWSWLCCAATCASKPTALVFPALLLALDLFRGVRPKGMHYLPPVACALATGVLAVYSQTHPAGYDVRDLFQASFPWRLLNAVVQLGLYAFQSFLPFGVHLDHRATPEHFPLDGTCGLISVLILATFVAWCIRRGGVLRRIVLFAAAFALFALLPTLGLFGSFGEHARADRFFYLPAVGLSAFVAFALVRLARPFLLCCTALVAVVFALSARVPIAAFANDEAVFARVLAFDSVHPRALAHVGNARCARGDFEGGIPLLRESQKCRPRFDVAAQLCFALATRGRMEDVAEIRARGTEVIADPSRDAKGQMLEALGMAAGLERDWKSAARFLSFAARAPRRFWSNEDTCYRLAVALYNDGRRMEAEKLFVPLAKSGRPFIRERAEEALALIQSKSKAVLFW